MFTPNYIIFFQIFDFITFLKLFDLISPKQAYIKLLAVYIYLEEEKIPSLALNKRKKNLARGIC
ncbi:MAG: hypothetical protein EAZ76_12355 [Nostocales cyanobacterium]|nr:MAG: hypothetical protein EAZ87_20735 [Nostocales cyanobacterium]TAF13114.1 MAG: hypothetical protein EAZ76_12355 [Nostocales cyanobacterium]